MRYLFKPGDVKKYTHKVSQDDTAKFESGEVHPVYATFALARDAEWVCRLFVLEMKEEDEEGIGTALNIKHLSPAPIGAEVLFTAKLVSVENNKVLCSFKAEYNNKLIAEGTQEQRILEKEKLNKIFKSI